MEPVVYAITYGIATLEPAPAVMAEEFLDASPTDLGPREWPSEPCHVRGRGIPTIHRPPASF